MVMVRDELVVQDVIHVVPWNADWVKVPLMETTQRVICATSNRVFVGAPLCASDFSYLINVVC
jgi:hypothetical protein